MRPPSLSIILTISTYPFHEYNKSRAACADPVRDTYKIVNSITVSGRFMSSLSFGDPFQQRIRKESVYDFVDAYAVFLRVLSESRNKRGGGQDL